MFAEQKGKEKLDMSRQSQTDKNVADFFAGRTVGGVEEVSAVIGLKVQIVGFVCAFAADGTAADMPVASRHVLHF